MAEEGEEGMTRQERIAQSTARMENDFATRDPQMLPMFWGMHVLSASTEFWMRFWNPFAFTFGTQPTKKDSAKGAP